MSGLLASARPHRIKAAHRRRGKVASGHRLYILNNPLSGTDPTGYACEAALGSNIKSCETITATEVNTDGSKGESRSTRENAGTLSRFVSALSNGGMGQYISGKAQELKQGVSALGKTLEPTLPGTGQAMQRGALGTWESNKEGFGLAIASPVVSYFNATSPHVLFGMIAPLPEVQYENDQLFGATAVEMVGLLATRGAGAEVSGLRSAARGVSPGEAGRFANLEARAVLGDALTPHHMPQAAAGFTSRADGGALVLPHDVHKMTRTYGARGAKTAREEAGVPFRQVMARDIRDVRVLTGSTYNKGILNLLQYYRQTAPELMAKP